MKSTDALIIGGGIIGTSAAFFLAKQGVDVTLIERGEIGREASGATAGSMALQNKELEVIGLSEESLKTWAELQKELNEDLEFRQYGGLRVAENPDQLERLRREVREQRKVGLELEMLSPGELKSFAPYLGSSVVGASFCEKDARGNPLVSSVALAKAARVRGAKVHVNESVAGIKVSNPGRFLVYTSKGLYRSSCIVNCAGVWAKDIFQMIGLDVAITLSPQQMIVTEQAPDLFSPIISHIEGNLTLKQVDSGNILIGGGWQAIGDVRTRKKSVRYESLEGNSQCACRVIPALRNLNVIRCWAGLEGRSPDLLPLLGNLKRQPGFYSACCAKGGFTMGPILGKLISELIVKGRTSFPITRFDINRLMDN